MLESISKGLSLPQTFIFDLSSDLDKQLHLDDFHCEVVDSHTIKVTVNKAQSLNSLFEALSSQNIEVSSMRNKSNRLEELFLSLVGENA